MKRYVDTPNSELPDPSMTKPRVSTGVGRTDWLSVCGACQLRTAEASDGVRRMAATASPASIERIARDSRIREHLSPVLRNAYVAAVTPAEMRRAGLEPATPSL